MFPNPAVLTWFLSLLLRRGSWGASDDRVLPCSVPVMYGCPAVLLGSKAQAPEEMLAWILAG